jgi:hypothetical protein
MRPQSYIGVTGFTNEAEIREVLLAYPSDARHRLMVGVLMDNQTLAGKKNEQPARYPERGAIAQIFVEHRNALNLVHYHTSSRGDVLLAELMAARRLAGPRCHGFQLNVKWPDPATLRAYHQSNKVAAKPQRDVIVLQCGPAAMAETAGATELARRVTAYNGLVDYALVDPSAGRGEPFNAPFASEAFGEISKVAPDIGLGVAGGLSAETVGELSALLRTYADFSIDAEGRLRDSNDNLNIAAAIAYSKAANKLFQQHPVTA